MTNVDLVILEKLAKEATPGPWTPSEEVDGAIEIIDRRLNRPMNLFGLSVDGYAITMNHKDAAFIAAANPIAVLKLIAIARAAIQINEITGEKPTLPAFVALRKLLGPSVKMLEAECQQMLEDK